MLFWQTDSEATVGSSRYGRQFISLGINGMNVKLLIAYQDQLIKLEEQKNSHFEIDLSRKYSEPIHLTIVFHVKDGPIDVKIRLLYTITVISNDADFVRVSVEPFSIYAPAECFESLRQKEMKLQGSNGSSEIILSYIGHDTVAGRTTSFCWNEIVIKSFSCNFFFFVTEEPLEYAVHVSKVERVMTG